MINALYSILNLDWNSCVHLYDNQIISLTTLVVKRTCKGTEVCMAGLARKKLSRLLF